jgi:hypothetical protein
MAILIAGEEVERARRFGKSVEPFGFTHQVRSIRTPFDYEG